MDKFLHKIFKKFNSPYEMNIFGLIFGVIIVTIILTTKFFFYRQGTDENFVYDIFLGFGVSLIGGAILNILSEWRTGNLLVQTVMDGIYQTAAKSRIVRYQQSITFVITDININEKDYLKFSCTHEYTLSNITYPEKSISIDTFNDISIPKEENDSLGDEKTQFNEVKIRYGTGTQHTHNRNDGKHNNEFTFDDYGRPHFATKGLIMKKSDETMTITFDINNIHNLRDKHMWYFEEITDGIVLRIDNKSSHSISNFKLIINHPNREDIEEHNKETIDSKGQIRGLSLNKNYSTIEMNYVFLPYQGFEIEWDIDNGVTED